MLFCAGVLSQIEKDEFRTGKPAFCSDVGHPTVAIQPTRESDCVWCVPWHCSVWTPLDHLSEKGEEKEIRGAEDESSK